MNKRIIGAVVMLIALIVTISLLMPEGIKLVRVGETIRPFTLPDLQDKMQGLPKGKVMIVNFWATWCPPCRKEVPSMVQLYETFKDKGFEIVAVSVDKRREDVVDFVNTYNMSFTVLHDADSQVAASYGVFRYPESFIVDKNGVVLQHLNGAVEWMSPEFVDYIGKLLAAPSS